MPYLLYKSGGCGYGCGYALSGSSRVGTSPCCSHSGHVHCLSYCVVYILANAGSLSRSEGVC